MILMCQKWISRPQPQSLKYSAYKGVYLYFFFQKTIFQDSVKGGVPALLSVGPFMRRAVINFNEESQGQRINFSFSNGAERILTTAAADKTEP